MLADDEPRGAPAAPAKNLGGRPKKRRGQEVEEPAASATAKEKEFWGLQQSITQAGWQQHSMYLYRWKPFYDKTRGGIEPKYVAFYNSATTIDEIKTSHGSGVYNLKLNRYNPATKQDQTISQVIFTILDPKYPPNLPAGEWQTDPRNKQWVWNKAEGAAAPGGGGTDTTMFREMREFFTGMVRERVPEREQDRVTAELVKILPELLNSKNGDKPPSILEIVTMVTTLIKTMTPAAPTAPAGPDPLILRMLDAAEKRADAAHAQMMALLTSDRADRKPPDMLAQVKTLGETVAAFSSAAETMGGGRPGGSTWASVVENVGVEVAKGVAPFLPRLFMQQPQPPRQAQAPQQARPPGQAPPMQQQAPPQVAGGPEQTMAPAGAVILDAAAQPNPASPQVEEEMKPMLIQALSQVAAPLLSYVNSGQTGIDFAWWIYDGYGAMPLNMLRGINSDPRLAREMLCELIRVEMTPLYQQLQPNWAQFETFVDELLSWTPQMIREEARDDEEDDEPQGAAPVQESEAPKKPAGAAAAKPKGKKK